jgi:hypothetical protein
VSAECQASCDASLNAEAECTPGEVAVVITGDVDENLTERLGRVTRAIEQGWGGIQVAIVKLERLGGAGRTLVETGRDVPDAVSSLGLAAVGCAGEAVGALPAAVGSISVSVEVSVTVTGSVSSS